MTKSNFFEITDFCPTLFPIFSQSGPGPVGVFLPVGLDPDSDLGGLW